VSDGPVPDLRTVRYEVAERVATVTLDRPDRLNAWTGRMHAEYRRCLAEAEGDPEVRVVVVTGAGRGFCAGADVGVLTGDDPDAIDALFGRLYDVQGWLHEGPLPVIVGARGQAPGASAILITSADLRVVGEETHLWWPEVGFGLEAFERAADLVTQVGATKATELMLLGEHAKLPADEARRLGLVNRVVADDTVEDEARAMAEQIAEYDREFGTVGGYLGAIQSARRDEGGAAEAYAAFRERVLDTPE
jgi:enoyl-CoA hydratase/carnithine racemase